MDVSLTFSPSSFAGPSPRRAFRDPVPPNSFVAFPYKRPVVLTLQTLLEPLDPKQLLASARSRRPAVAPQPQLAAQAPQAPPSPARGAAVCRPPCSSHPGRAGPRQRMTLAATSQETSERTHLVASFRPEHNPTTSSYGCAKATGGHPHPHPHEGHLAARSGATGHLRHEATRPRPADTAALPHAQTHTERQPRGDKRVRGRNKTPDPGGAEASGSPRGRPTWRGLQRLRVALSRRVLHHVVAAAWPQHLWRPQRRLPLRGQVQVLLGQVRPQLPDLKLQEERLVGRGPP